MPIKNNNEKSRKLKILRFQSSALTAIIKA